MKSISIIICLNLCSCVGIPFVPFVQNQYPEPNSKIHLNGEDQEPIVHIAAKTAAKKGTYYGKASWYCIKCNGGTATASGEKLKDNAYTAAHKTLPMGTKVRVTNLVNGKSAVVRINDRGPYIKGRIIDVTKGVASKLGFLKAGVVKCKVEVL